MKTVILTFLIILSLNIQAQTYFEEITPRSISVEAIPTANRTVYGWKYGVSVGLNISDKWNIGYSRVQNSGTSETGQKLYSGAYLQRAINPKSRLVIVPTLKVGLYDGQFLAIQPTIEVDYKVKKNTQFLVGIGRVDGYPSFDFGLRLKIARIK
jgi:hypothetical protein